MKWLEIKKENWEKHIKIHNLLGSELEVDKLIAQETGLAICEQTLKLLEFCTPYYEYVGIRTYTPINVYKDWGLDHSAFGQPFGIEKREDWNDSKIESTGDKDGWPAIWAASKYAGFESSCGNHHQKQIDKQGTTGLYWNKNGKWFKQII